jgi:hypothetical protein
VFKPFIFPSQATKLFFFDDIKKPGWKVVLWMEVRSRIKVANIENVFITTTMETCGSSALITLPTCEATFVLLLSVLQGDYA